MEPRTQCPEEEQDAPALSAAAAAAAAAGAGAGAYFASSGDLLPSLVASEGVRTDNGGGDEWAMAAQWNTMQPSGGGGGGSSGNGSGYVNESGALNRTPSIFDGQPGGNCGGGGGGSGSGALSGAPAVCGREEVVVGCGEAGASAWGSDQRAEPGWTQAISDGYMDVTDSL